MKNILIVDDERDIQILYSQILTLYGFDVTILSNGMEAIEYYKNIREKPDIIIMDYYMPFINGLEALKVILTINPYQKVLMISGTMNIKIKALEMGATGFEFKPVSLKKLVTIVNDMLKSERKEEAVLA